MSRGLRLRRKQRSLFSFEIRPFRADITHAMLGLQEPLSLRRLRGVWLLVKGQQSGDSQFVEDVG